jgi:hypothetical protein
MTDTTISRGDTVSLTGHDGTLTVHRVDHRFGTAIVEDAKGRRFSFGMSKLSLVTKAA